MTAPAVLARRLALPPGELVTLCARLGLLIPPGFDADLAPVSTDGLLLDGQVHPSLTAGLAATCSPQVGVQLSSTAHRLVGAFGVRRDLGGSMLRTDVSDVEVAAWPAERLGAEVARAVPALGSGEQLSLHLPLEELAGRPELRDTVVGRLRATVHAPPSVVGHVTWLATTSGWLALRPAETLEGRRWATVSPVVPADLGADLAPLVAAALS